MCLKFVGAILSAIGGGKTTIAVNSIIGNSCDISCCWEELFFMTMKKSFQVGKVALIGVTLMCVAGCRRDTPRSTGAPSVFVTIPPQKYFVEKIGGEYFTVATLIPPGASPHSYEPKPVQMAQLSKARLYFAIGVEMEKVWLPRIRAVNPALVVVATDSGIEKISGGCDAGAHHDHDTGDSIAGQLAGESAEHAHTGADPHIWLSPQLVKQQARTIAAALMHFDTIHAEVFQERLLMFEQEIESLHATIEGQLSQCGANGSFLVFHPSWGYFAREFSLHQLSIETEGKEPGIRELGAIVKNARARGVGAVLVQPQFSRALATTIAKEMALPTAIADPLAEDWAQNLLRITGVLCEK